MLSLKSVDEVAEMSRSVGLIIGICLAPFYLFIDALDPSRSMPTFVCSAALVSTVYIQWDLRRKVWFWLVVLALAAAHSAAIMWIPWSSTKLYWVELMPIALADFGFNYLVIKFLEKAVGSQSPP